MPLPSYKKDNIFYAEIAKGFDIKVIIETLKSLKRAKFKINKSGIYSRPVDDKFTIIFDLVLESKRFRKFYCKKEIILDLNLVHFQDAVKNAKKKDKIRLNIRKDSPKKLNVCISPQNSSDDEKKEISSLAIQYIDSELYDVNGLPEGEYKNPKNINSADFQVIKQLAKINKKTIQMTIQGTHYLSMYSDADGIKDKRCEFGTIVSCPSEENEYESEESDYESENSSENSSEDEYGIYEACFDTDLLLRLCKLPGMCDQLEFYAPHVDTFPLFIKARFDLGHISVFIKDQKRIRLEEEERKKTERKKNVE